MNQKTPTKALLPHQFEGAAALFAQDKSKSVLIGDEPRVGKTFTAIQLELMWRNSGKLSGGGRTLVVS